MGVVVSMLRGINLGRHHRIRMDALRALYDSLDLREPQTYVQSGNVIFKTCERNLVRLAARIENAFERAFHFHSDVILRTSPDLRDVIAKNPCRTRQGIHPSRLLVLFLAADPGDQARETVRKIKTDPEELWMEGRHLYIYYPDGMARPKLSWALLERTLKTPGTGRNWNSVTKLLELAEKMEGS